MKGCSGSPGDGGASHEEPVSSSGLSSRATQKSLEGGEVGPFLPHSR